MTTSNHKILGDLVMAHKGQRICLMGGGPNLVSDLELVKADVWISINEHGAKHRKPDYVVAMDNIHTRLKVPMDKHIRQYTDAPIIGPWHWCDYQITRWPMMPKVILSGVVGSWVAYLMGAHPIIFAGFDCYGGDRKTIEQHEQYIKELKCEVRVASGPLQKFYPAYVAREKRKDYNVPDVFKEAFGDLIKVRVMKPILVHGHEWPVGTELTISAFEYRRQIKHKSLMVI